MLQIQYEFEVYGIVLKVNNMNTKFQYAVDNIEILIVINISRIKNIKFDINYN